MSLNALLETAILAEGEIFLRATPEGMKNGLHLSKDGKHIDLEEVDGLSSNLQNLPFQTSFAFEDDAPSVLEYDRDGAEAAFGASVQLNALQDWAVENGRTIQIRFGTQDVPHTLKLRGSIVIPATKRPRFVEALIACHRASAVLCVEFHAAGLKEPEVVETPFQSRFRGGQVAEGYQKVRIPVPVRGEDVTVNVSIRYNGFSPDEEDNYPYAFIANLGAADARRHLSKLVPRSNDFAQSRSGKWLRARVPLFRERHSEPLMLGSGRTSNALFTATRNKVHLEADYGHTLSLRADEEQTFLLYIDGEQADTVHIGEGARPIRLPAKFLRGEPLQVSIRDLSGSQEFLATAVLAPRMLTPEEIILRESRAPFPTDLTVRANHRYKALRAHIEQPVPGLDTESLNTAIKTLDRNYETLKIRPLTFPEVENPKVSVVIPAHNKVNVTYYGLCALLVAHNKASFEVIVVDDASTDETSEIENTVSGIKVVRNTEAQRFIRACNAGVAAARGEYVVLLNNDTEPTVGWLDHLIDAFERFDGVGAVGSKLLYPNGELQDAGGIIWGSGNPWNYGNRQNPWDPRFCYARQADYLSGAAMMTSKKIWDEVGGLSSYLEPMYFEDTDLAFKVREAGYKTYFVPSSIVYHFEGMTSGTDVSSGFKRYQEVNRPKFKRRWAKEYARFGTEGQKPDLEKDRGIIGRVLFIDYTTPREDRDAGSYAARREIELVQSLGYKVTFLPQNLAHLGSYTEELEKTGVEMISAPFVLSIGEFLEKRAAEFDAIYITRYYVAQEIVDRVRQLAPKARIILNNADLHFLRELRAAISTNDENRLAAAETVREQELAQMQKADVVLSYNEVEHSVIASHTNGKAKVMTCPWVVHLPAEVPPLANRKGLSFLGSFNHHPNAEGVKWFCQEVMPHLDGSKTHLTIYGSGMNDDIRALASENVEPAGFVENIADAYDQHRIFTAPLLSGAGIKGKVLSALAHGIPTVLTPVAAEGIGLRHKHDCLIAETPQAWADAILALSNDDEMWQNMSNAARSYASESFSFEAGRQKMKAAFEAVDLFGAL